MLVFPCRAIAAAGAITSRAAIGALVVTMAMLVPAGRTVTARTVTGRAAVDATRRVRDMDMLAGGAVGAAAPVTG
jgi:hypothetical protein